MTPIVFLTPRYSNSLRQQVMVGWIGLNWAWMAELGVPFEAAKVIHMGVWSVTPMVRNMNFQCM
jgi:hypothetical protein